MLHTSKYGVIDCTESGGPEAQSSVQVPDAEQSDAATSSAQVPEAEQSAAATSSQWEMDEVQGMYKYFDNTLNVDVYHDSTQNIFKYLHNGQWVQKQ
jgi:hypothetical protein